MSKNENRSKWFFGGGWIIANVFAWGVFYIIAILSRWAEGTVISNLLLKIFPITRIDFFSGTLIGAVVCWLIWGTLAGALQRLVLARRLAQKGKGWILATLLGLLPLAIYLFLYYIMQLNIGFPDDSYPRLALYFTIAAYCSPFALALAQWLVLRRTFTRSAWWPVAVLIVTGLVTLTMPALAQLYRQKHALLLLTPAGIGLIYGLATWIVLAFLSPRKELATQPEMSQV